MSNLRIHAPYTIASIAGTACQPRRKIIEGHAVAQLPQEVTCRNCLTSKRYQYMMQYRSWLNLNTHSSQSAWFEPYANRVIAAIEHHFRGNLDADGKTVARAHCVEDYTGKYVSCEAATQMFLPMLRATEHRDPWRRMGYPPSVMFHYAVKALHQIGLVEIDWGENIWSSTLATTPESRVLRWMFP